MALKDEYGDLARHLWHAWSARASTQYNYSSAESAWKSFSGGGVTIGSLIYTAQQSGFTFGQSTQDDEATGFTVDLSYLFAKKSPVAPRPR